MRLPHTQLDESSDFNSANNATSNERLWSLRCRKGSSSRNVGENVDDVEDIVDNDDSVNGVKLILEGLTKVIKAANDEYSAKAAEENRKRESERKSREEAEKAARAERKARAGAKSSGERRSSSKKGIGADVKAAARKAKEDAEAKAKADLAAKRKAAVAEAEAAVAAAAEAPVAEAPAAEAPAAE